MTVWTCVPTGSFGSAGLVSGPAQSGKSVRIGLTLEVKRVLRFYESGNSFVSGPKQLRAQTVNALYLHAWTDYEDPLRQSLLRGLGLTLVRRDYSTLPTCRALMEEMRADRIVATGYGRQMYQRAVARARSLRFRAVARGARHFQLVIVKF